MAGSSYQALPADGDAAAASSLTSSASPDASASASASASATAPSLAHRLTSAFRKPPAADLSTGRVAAYGVGAFTLSIILDVSSFYLSPFLLENVGLSAVATGNLLLIAKIFDAFVDPIIGASSDATRSRFGRRRPWFLASLPISVLFNVLLWTVWPGMAGNEGAQFAYFLISYCMAVFGLGLFYIPYSAMPTTISSKDIDRVRLTTSRVFYMIFGDMIGVGVLAVCSILYPDDGNRSYQVAAGINSAIVAAVILVTFFGVPEPSSEHMPRKSVRAELKLFFVGIGYLVRSWTYMSLTLMASLGWLAIYFVQNNLYLYAKYAANMPELFDPVLLLALGSCAIFVPFWAFLLNYMSKRKVMAVGIVWLTVTWVLVTILPAENVPFICVVAILSGGGISVANLMPWVFLADVIDDDELQHGHRREGLLSAFFVFVNKVAVGMSLAISGYVLSAGGYDNSAGEPEPTEELNRTMRLLCGVLPAVCAAMMVPLLYFHPITHTRQLEINRRIVEQRALEKRNGGVGEKAALLRDSEAPAPSSLVADASGPLASASDVSFGRGQTL